MTALLVMMGAKIKFLWKNENVLFNIHFFLPIKVSYSWKEISNLVRIVTQEKHLQKLAIF